MLAREGDFAPGANSVVIEHLDPPLANLSDVVASLARLKLEAEVTSLNDTAILLTQPSASDPHTSTPPTTTLKFREGDLATIGSLDTGGTFDQQLGELDDLALGVRKSLSFSASLSSLPDADRVHVVVSGATLDNVKLAAFERDSNPTDDPRTFTSVSRIASSGTSFAAIEAKYTFLVETTDQNGMARRAITISGPTQPFGFIVSTGSPLQHLQGAIVDTVSSTFTDPINNTFFRGTLKQDGSNVVESNDEVFFVGVEPGVGPFATIREGSLYQDSEFLVTSFDTPALGRLGARAYPARFIDTTADSKPVRGILVPYRANPDLFGDLSHKVVAVGDPVPDVVGSTFTEIGSVASSEQSDIAYTGMWNTNDTTTTGIVLHFAHTAQQTLVATEAQLAAAAGKPNARITALEIDGDVFDTTLGISVGRDVLDFPPTDYVVKIAARATFDDGTQAIIATTTDAPCSSADLALPRAVIDFTDLLAFLDFPRDTPLTEQQLNNYLMSTIFRPCP